MTRILFILMFIFSIVDLCAQNDVDYQHKSLEKVLQKDNEVALNQVVELNIPDSVRKHYKYIQGKFFTVNNETSTYKYVYVGRVNSCRAGGCSIALDENTGGLEGKSEYFDYFMCFDQNKTVQLVKVFNYQASHGQEVCAKGWLKQFVGYKESEVLQVGKNVDAISGATISVNAITFDVELKTEILGQL